MNPCINQTTRNLDVCFAEITKHLATGDTKLVGEQIATAKTFISILRLELVYSDNKTYSSYLEKFKEFNRQYRWLKLTEEKKEVQNVQYKPDTELTIIQHGDNIQQSSIDALNTINQTIAQSKDVGIGTAEKLQSQQEQINRIYSSLLDIDAEIIPAGKRIKNMARNVALNKCLWIMLLLIAGCVGIVIYLKIK